MVCKHSLLFLVFSLYGRAKLTYTETNLVVSSLQATLLAGRLRNPSECQLDRAINIIARVCGYI